MDFDAVLSRIKELKGLKYDYEVASLLGLSKTGLAERKTRNSLPMDKMELFCAKESINLNWLLTGEEPKYSGEANAGKRPFIGPDISPYEGDLIEVKIYALAGAGDPKGLTAGEPIEMLVIPKEFAANHILPVRVEGDSMEPTLNDGATVGVDTHDTRIVSGKVYVVWLDYEGAVVKRVFVEPGRVVLKSDNPLFPSSHVALSDAPEHFVMGRVKWVIQKL